jgi:hypothetical protein
MRMSRRAFAAFGFGSATMLAAAQVFRPALGADEVTPGDAVGAFRRAMIGFERRSPAIRAYARGHPLVSDADQKLVMPSFRIGMRDCRRSPAIRAYARGHPWSAMLTRNL